MASKLGGAVIFQLSDFDVKQQRLTLTLSDAGLCGAAPHLSGLEDRWTGDIDNLQSLQVATTSTPAVRQWTTEDRRQHGVLLKRFKDDTLQGAGYTGDEAD